jgi:squalene synthase HpnC
LNKEIENRTLELAKFHYENFPVASFLLPINMRKHVAIIYWFARTADDFADEGNLKAEDRLKNLNEFENEFTALLNHKSSNQYFILLKKTIDEKKIDPKHFYDLLSAFKQDVVKNRYENFSEILDYCNRSANPVGRIILELNNVCDKDAIKYSDKICTALQLTNFYQDTKIDYNKGRIYYPVDEMKKFNVTENMFELNKNNPHISALVKHNVDRTQKLFDEGKNILDFLRGSLKTEIKWTIFGGEAILNKIRKNNFEVLAERPKLSKLNYLFLFMKALFR